MTDEQDAEVLAYVRRRFARRKRGEVRTYRSDDLRQPSGAVECTRGAPCVMCGEPCGNPHIHLYERDPEAVDLDTLLEALGQIGSDLNVETSRHLAESLTRMREHGEASPLGFCSEGCAGRYAAGEPTPHEHRWLEETPYTHVLLWDERAAGDVEGGDSGESEPLL